MIHMVEEGGIHTSHTNYTVNEDRTEERTKALDVLSGKEKVDQLIQALNHLLSHQQEMEKGLSDQQMQQAIAFYQQRYEHYRQEQERREAENQVSGGGILHDLLAGEEEEEQDPSVAALQDMKQFMQSIRGSAEEDRERRRDQIAQQIDRLATAIQADQLTDAQKNALNEVLNTGDGNATVEEYINVGGGSAANGGAGGSNSS